MDWDNRYFDALGPWSDFVDRIWTEGGGGPQALGVVLLEVKSGHHVKLPVRHSIHDFGEALRRLEPLEAAAIAVSLAVESGSVAALSASFRLLRSQVEDRLANMHTAQAARFVLAAIVGVPPPLRPALAVPLFVEALVAKVPGAERALPAQCRTLADRVAIRQVGLACGKLAWIRVASTAGSYDSGGAAPAGSSVRLDPPDATVSVIPASQPAGASEDAGTTCQGTAGGEAKRAGTANGDAPAGMDNSAAMQSEVAEDGIHPDTRRVCRRVRRAFGLEPGLARPTQATLDVVNRSIQRLAADLYAKEVHFILEVSKDEAAFAIHQWRVSEFELGSKPR